MYAAAGIRLDDDLPKLHEKQLNAGVQQPKLQGVQTCGMVYRFSTSARQRHLAGRKVFAVVLDKQCHPIFSSQEGHQTVKCCGCRQQLIEVLGQSMADEVIALQAGSVPKAPQAQPIAGIATDPAMPQQQSSPGTVKDAIDVHASQAAAEVLHHQADAAIPAGSQLADSLALNRRHDGKGSLEDDVGSAVRSAVAETDVKLKTDQQDSAISVAEGSEGQVSPEAAGGSNTAAAGRTPPLGLTVLRSNPRFAVKPVKPAVDADAVEVNDPEGGLEGSTAALCITDVLIEWQHLIFCSFT